MTLSRLAPAVSRHSFICSMTSSLCRSIGTSAISPVSGSNGGSPATKIMLPARVTGETGAFRRSRNVEIGSTRSASRFIPGFMGGHLRFKRDDGLLHHLAAAMLRFRSKCRRTRLGVLRHLLGLFLGEQQQHLDAHVAFLRRSDELYFVGALPQRGNDRDGLIGRCRLGCQNCLLVLGLKPDGVGHAFPPGLSGPIESESRAERKPV